MTNRMNEILSKLDWGSHDILPLSKLSILVTYSFSCNTSTLLRLQPLLWQIVHMQNCLPMKFVNRNQLAWGVSSTTAAAGGAVAAALSCTSQQNNTICNTLDNSTMLTTIAYT